MPKTGFILHERYRVLREIGRGGSSVVYLCEDVNMGKLWAVKEISLKSFDQSPGRNLLSDGDIRHLKKLDHPMFPRITDAFYEGENYYIICDYIEGMPLAKLIKISGIIPMKRAADIGIRLLSALMYLHAQSPPILYLDMKPENVIIRPDGQVRLIDFGIARSILEGNSCMGTAGYSPPEQYGGKHGGKPDTRSDIFSLGMTLYAMVTGMKPIDDLTGQTRLISENSSIDTGFKHIILNCIKAEVSDRFTDRQLYLRLKNLKNREKRRMALTAGALILFAAAIPGMIISGSRDKRESDPAASMVESLNEHIENGEYTPEGIRIICGYLDGGFLEGEVKENFSFEVSRYFIESERNFSGAKRYLKNLDDERYPEAIYLMKICEYMTGFDKPDLELESCLSEFETYNSALKESDRKKKNEKTIALLKKQILYAKNEGEGNGN